MATIIPKEPVSTIQDVRPSDPPRPETCETFSTDEGRLAQVRSTLMSDAAAATLAETFRALGDPTRVRILDALSRGELCVCEISTLVGLSESAVSHQLRLLRSLRVVKARRQGRMVYYTLDDHHVRDLFTQGLRHVEEHELARLASFGRR